MKGRCDKFDFAKDYILEDDFVKLIPLKSKHIKDLLKISNDPEIWKYFFEKGDTLENLTQYVLSAIANRKVEKKYPFVVLDRHMDQYAGVTCFYQYSSELQTIKLGHTWYGKEFRGTALNKHCKYLLFEFAFEALGVERIGFGAYADNHVSIAAMKSVGCQTEGFLRNMFPSLDGNGRTDAILLSILKNEWQESIKSELKNKLSA